MEAYYITSTMGDQVALPVNVADVKVFVYLLPPT